MTTVKGHKSESVILPVWFHSLPSKEGNQGLESHSLTVNLPPAQSKEVYSTCDTIISKLPVSVGKSLPAFTSEC
jgi:hypothetical protein